MLCRQAGRKSARAAPKPNVSLISRTSGPTCVRSACAAGSGSASRNKRAWSFTPVAFEYALREREAHVWIADLAALDGQAVHLAAILSAEERADADRMR